MRDAVTRLVAQGVLQQGPRNSAIVPNLTRKELADLTVVRCALEGRAAREAALQQHDAAALRRLEERLTTMQSLIQARKLESYLEHHRKFHFGIYAMSGIPLLVETIENMWLRCGPVLSFVIPEYVVLLKGWDHHTAALKAIVAGDADARGARDRRRYHRSRALSRRPCGCDRAIAPAARLVRRGRDRVALFIPHGEEARSAVSNHEAPPVPFILRDAAVRLLRMRSDTL